MAFMKFEDQILDFEFENEKIEKVECNLEVEDDSRWNKINIKSYDPRLPKLQDKTGINITISLLDNNGEVYKKTEIFKCSIINFNVNMGHVITFEFSLRPTASTVIFNRKGARNKRNTVIRYYINKAPMFAPFFYTQTNENGNIKQKKGKPLEFKTLSGLTVISDTLFSFQSKDGHLESDQYQILTTKISTTKNIIDTIKKEVNPHIDDIILLMSFLNDNRINYTSWRAELNSQTIFYYKSNVIKAENINSNPTTELINRGLIMDFFESTLPLYSNSEYRDEIRNCINSLTIRKGNVIELAFLSYFQGLESLILVFKREKNVEFILDNEKFKALKKALEATITDLLPDNKVERGKIKNKLNELNRFSLKESALMFFQDYNIEIDDLWPLFDNVQKRETGLSTIRNFLIHGDLIPRNHLINVAIASEHLRILLTRCIFRLLNWDLSKTNVSEEHLKKNHYQFNIERKEKPIIELSEYFASKKAIKK